MTKNELIAAVADKAQMTKTAAATAVDATFDAITAALKKGGILAVEQHRANPSATEKPQTGYVTEGYVIDQAEKAGFKVNPGLKDDIKTALKGS